MFANNWLLFVIGIVIAAVIAFFLSVTLSEKKIAEAKISSAEEASKKILEDAYKEADSKKREALVEAKEEVLKMKNEGEKEVKERRNEVNRMERRLLLKRKKISIKT